MGFELKTLVVIGTDCTGSCKSNYHMIMTTAAPTGEGSQELAHRTVQHVPRLWKAIVENREYPSLVWRVHLRLQSNLFVWSPLFSHLYVFSFPVVENFI